MVVVLVLFLTASDQWLSEDVRFTASYARTHTHARTHARITYLESE